MTLNEIESRVSHVRMHTKDPKYACQLERELWSDFIRFVAAGRCTQKEMSRLAEAMLETEKIDFHR